MVDNSSAIIYCTNLQCWFIKYKTEFKKYINLHFGIVLVAFLNCLTENGPVGFKLIGQNTVMLIHWTQYKNYLWLKVIFFFHPA